jgi:hypothetical protein
MADKQVTIRFKIENDTESAMAGINEMVRDMNEEGNHWFMTTEEVEMEFNVKTGTVEVKVEDA